MPQRDELPKPELLAKISATSAAIKTVFFHDEYYVRLILAALASRAFGCIEGASGEGKTHLILALLKTIAADAQGKQQGTLNADYSEVIATADLGEMQQGREKVKWRRIVSATVKFFDEIQRLGPMAQSALFRMLDNRERMEYLDQICEGEPDKFIVFATANPTSEENPEDTLNVPIPPPLWDRFHWVMWLPTASLGDQAQINDQDDDATFNAIKPIWQKSDLLALWSDCARIVFPPKMKAITTDMVRITNFCKFAQGHDAHSLPPEKKRALCTDCNDNYLCHEIAKAPSTRAKKAFQRLARGFAYIAGHDEVTMQDLRDAFAPVFWKRLSFMEETSNPAAMPDRLKALNECYDKLDVEITECNELIESALRLRQQFDPDDMQKLHDYANTKVWTVEMLTEVQKMHTNIGRQLQEKQAAAKAANDTDQLKAISEYAAQVLPPAAAKPFYFKDTVTIDLDPKSVARLGEIDPILFRKAERHFLEGHKTLTLTDDEARTYREANKQKKTTKAKE